MEIYRQLRPNWLVCTDGGCQGGGQSAYSWLIYAAPRTHDEWPKFAIAFGFQMVAANQISFIVEAQALDTALDVFCSFIGIIV